MTEFRVGDWVKPKSVGFGIGPSLMEAVDERAGLCGRATLSGGALFQLNELEFCAPDPLPERLPAGTRYRIGASSPRTITESPHWRNTAWTGGRRVEDGDDAYECDCLVYPAQVFWDSYHAALHAEQDAIPPCGLCKVVHPSGWDCALSPDERLANLALSVRCEICTAEPLEPCNTARGCGYHNSRLEAAERAQAPVREPCGFCGAPHGERHGHSCPQYPRVHLDEESVEPVEKDSRPVSVTGAGPARSRSESVGSERGDSGTGQAAGEKRSDSSTRLPADPAASSGFQAPKTAHDVECPLHGASWCKDSEGRPKPNCQLRTDRFEAMRVVHTVEARRMTDGDVNGFVKAKLTKVAKLRSDLDRPLPRALTTWPEAWSSATGESDH